MKCEKCVEEGRKSRIYEPGGGATTLAYYAPYYDEEGTRHIHDGNTTTSEWSCSNGHKWSFRTRSGCPQGDYEGMSEVTFR